MAIVYPREAEIAKSGSDPSAINTVKNLSVPASEIGG
jgi:hypothetical protein